LCILHMYLGALYVFFNDICLITYQKIIIIIRQTSKTQ